MQLLVNAVYSFSVELMQEKQNKEYLKLPTDRQGINTLHETIEQLRVNLEMECDDVHQETNTRLLQESTYKVHVSLKYSFSASAC